MKQISESARGLLQEHPRSVSTLQRAISARMTTAARTARKDAALAKKREGSAECRDDESAQSRPDGPGDVKGDAVQRNGGRHPSFRHHILHSGLPGRKADRTAESQAESQSEQHPRRGESKQCQPTK